MVNEKFDLFSFNWLPSVFNRKFLVFLKNWFSSTVNEVGKNLKWSKKKQIQTLKQISLLMKNKVYLNDVATILIKFGNKKEKVIGKKIKDCAREGWSLDVALKDDLSQGAYESLSAGILADNPIPGLDNAVSSLELNESMTGSLMWQFAKPTIGVIAGLAATVGYSKIFVPKILPMLPINRFPWLSGVVNDFGNLCAEYGLSVFFFTVVFLISVLVSLPILTGSFRSKIDNFIIYRQYRILVSTSALQSLSNLKKSKITLVDSLTKIRDTSSPYVAQHFDLMINNLGEGEGGESGDNLGVVMDTGLLLDDQIQVLKMLGSKTDHDTILKSSAELHQNKLISEISLIKKLGDGALKIIGFLLVGSILAAVVLAVLEIAITINLG
jgi:type II secretory pathway component PulF